MGSLLRLRDVRQRRGGRELLAVDELAIGAGERLAVLGPNGAGKTTLLRLLAGLDSPAAGTVLLDGEPLEPRDTERRRQIGYATQRPGLLATTVSRNVELPLRWRGMPRDARRAAAVRALERLGAAHLADRSALSLSGGEAQRVSLARALALEPSVLLLDEPAASLDAPARQELFDDLESALGPRSATVVHVSHRADEALRLADRVAVLAEGRIRQLGEPAAVVREPADATVARLVGYENVLAVEIDAAGRTLLGGVPTGVEGSDGGEAGTLAVWASAVRVGPPGAGEGAGGGIPALVERVAAGPGRWELVLSGPATLRAQLPLSERPPAPGERVGVSIDPEGAALIRRRPRAPAAALAGARSG